MNMARLLSAWSAVLRWGKWKQISECFVFQHQHCYVCACETHEWGEWECDGAFLLPCFPVREKKASQAGRVQRINSDSFMCCCYMRLFFFYNHDFSLFLMFGWHQYCKPEIVTEPEITNSYGSAPALRFLYKESLFLQTKKLEAKCVLALSGERGGKGETEKVRVCSVSRSELFQCAGSEFLLGFSKAAKIAHLVASGSLTVRGGWKSMWMENFKDVNSKLRNLKKDPVKKWANPDQFPDPQEFPYKKFHIGLSLWV